MSRRRGERRRIHGMVPTRDGKQVAVRSATIAERLYGQQRVIEQQAERIAALERRRAEDRERIAGLDRGLRHFMGRRLIRMLLRLRLVSWPPARMTAFAPEVPPADAATGELPVA